MTGYKKIELREYLKNNLILADGAMATLLYQMGVPVNTSTEELCLTNPDVVANVHAQYYAAGARFIETNTFNAHREGLARYGLDDQVWEINKRAVAIARSAVGEDAYIIGGIGSITGGRVRNPKMAGYRELFREQVEALLQSGVDGILLETFLDVEEALLALSVVREHSDLPLFINLSMIEVGRTRDGYSLSEAFKRLIAGRVDGVGLNCRMGPLPLLRALEQAVIDEQIPIAVFPNAGKLGLSDGEYEYESGPLYFAETALRFREVGVRIFGGCCGTTPAHIAAMRDALKGMAPMVRVNPVINEVAFQEHQPTTVAKRRETIVDTVKKRHTVIVELDTPKNLDTDKFFKGVLRLKEAGVDALTMADNSLATTRMSNMALGAIMKGRYGIEPLVHIACRDRNLIGQQSHLMGLHALNIDQVLVITGDPAKIGDLPGASSVFDVTSFELIRMIKQFNEGISFSGSPLKQNSQFVVGAAFNPHVRNLEPAIKRLEKKVESGADYIMTQPVFDCDTMTAIHEATKHISVPIFIGIMPLTGIRMAKFLHHEVPGIKLSQEAMERISLFEGEAAREEGIKMAKVLIDHALPLFKGIYLITPFMFYEMTAELTEYTFQKAQALEVT